MSGLTSLDHMWKLSAKKLTRYYGQASGKVRFVIVKKHINENKIIFKSYPFFTYI